jgi:hypothetical protein
MRASICANTVLASLPLNNLHHIGKYCVDTSQLQMAHLIESGMFIPLAKKVP